MTEQNLAERRRKQTIWLLAIIIVVGIAVIPRCGPGLPRLEGVVVGADTGEPLADVRIESWAEYTATVYGPGGPGGGLSSSRVTHTNKDGRFAIPGKHRAFWWQMMRLTNGVFSVFRSGWGVVRGSYGEESVTIRGVLVGGEDAPAALPVRQADDSMVVTEWFGISKATIPFDETDIVIPLVKLQTTEQWEEHFDSLDQFDRFPLELRAEELLRYVEGGAKATQPIAERLRSYAVGWREQPELCWRLCAAYHHYCQDNMHACKSDYAEDLQSWAGPGPWSSTRQDEGQE